MARPALSGSRTIEILNFLTSRPDHAFTLTEIANKIEINLASAHAVLAAMIEAGFLVRHPVHRTYELGPMLIPIGRAAQARHGAVSLAREQLEGVANQLDLEGLVVGATSDDLVIFERVGRAIPHGLVTTVGHRISIIAPLAALFAAFASEKGTENWFAKAADQAPATRQRLLAILESIQARGFSVGLRATERQRMQRVQSETRRSRSKRAVGARLDSTGSDYPEIVLSELDTRKTYRVSHIAGPVFDQHGNVTVALYLVGFPSPLSGAKINEIGQALVRLGISVTRATGGTPPRGSNRWT